MTKAKSEEERGAEGGKWVQSKRGRKGKVRRGEGRRVEERVRCRV